MDVLDAMENILHEGLERSGMAKRISLRVRNGEIPDSAKKSHDCVWFSSHCATDGPDDMAAICQEMAAATDGDIVVDGYLSGDHADLRWCSTQPFNRRELLFPLGLPEVGQKVDIVDIVDGGEGLTGTVTMVDRLRDEVTVSIQRGETA